jgi:hypothetical protein
LPLLLPTLAAWAKCTALLLLLLLLLLPTWLRRLQSFNQPACSPSAAISAVYVTR